ncbi:MAG: mechanosensitive ion channel [Okeania sp. SIO2F4]|uniref:mechanosensitive ion channel domain-containing protein n=1 Tax=Okeania sp. SIO2F4 TaxID=2607790 RepID=UPI00142D136C|nr:mechanosensitive ion channel domain-containing protein [Okeania sp. SIO2F4]NES02481.1 mechanosensitive ion channel [Okeania sp. SIO2F4]
MWHKYLWLKLTKVTESELGSRPLAKNNPLIISANRKTATRQIFKILIIACLIPLLFFIVPAWGQANNNDLETAPVELNGKDLFEVAGNEEENLTATKRAEIISSKLENIFTSGESIELNIYKKHQQIILAINNDDLLTITAEDVKAGINTEEQAAIWKYKIEDGFESAKKDTQSPNLFKVLLISIFLILAAVVLELFLRWLEFKINKICEEKYPQIVKYLPKLLPFMAISIRVIVWVGIILYITYIIPFTRDYRNLLLEILGNSFTSPIFNLGNKGLSIVDVVTLIGLTIIMWKGVGYFINIFRTKIIGLTGADRSVQDTISFLTRYGLIFLGILIILQLWGIDISSLAIIASVLGVGIGFGLQNIANNFISGIILVFERPIQVGDFIQVENLVGIVEKIGLRSTHITTLDKVSLIVPNSRFLENEVLNWSHGNPISRMKIPIGVAYGSNIKSVRKAILEVAKSHPEVLLHPSPQLWFQEFGDSSLNFDLLVWTREPRKQSQLKSELNYRIEASLRRYKVEIPFPQRDLHLKSPEIEQMIETWMRKNSPPHVELYYPDSVQFKLENNISQLDIDEEDDAKVLTKDSLNNQINKNINIDIDIDTLVEEMRGLNGVSIKDRQHRWDTYSKCFVGSEAVKWLMETQKLNLNQAISLGQLLIDRGLIHHVVDRHGFKNQNLFYRFYEDEQ